jgi:hypothetical protein
MKWNWVTGFFWTFALACQDNPNEKGTSRVSLNENRFRVVLEATTPTTDSCDPRARVVHYETPLVHYRTLYFTEGTDSFRLVPDTFQQKYALWFDVHLQAQRTVHCWKTLDTFRCRQFGVSLMDWNGDGFLDLSNDFKWWKEITFYNPATHTFVHKAEVGSSVETVHHPVKSDWKSDRMSDSIESRLFRFENYDIQIYARLNFVGTHNSEIPKVIRLYTVQKGNESLVQEWLPSQWPTYLKNNKVYRYFDIDEFIRQYWKKNWKKYVPN